MKAETERGCGARSVEAGPGARRAVAPALRFSPMRQEDLAEVAAIERLASAGSGWTPGVFADALACGHECWVARGRQGRLVGHAVMAASTGRGHLLNLLIRPSERGRRHGAALARQMIERARQRGVTALTLEVRPSNAVAGCLYAALGFREVGWRKNFYRCPREAARLLELRFAP